MSIATPTRPVSNSLADLTSSLNADERALLLMGHEPDELLHAWWFWARPDQLPPPGTWRVWLVMAGRGFGKTRTGAEWVRQRIRRYPYTNIIGATADDARDIMIEGESGILAICPDHERPVYLPSKRRLEWPNGARTLIFTADEPERLRGKQHDGIWADEVAAWRYGVESWDQAMFGLRLGDDPRAVATTTPKPVKVIRDLLDQATDGTVVVTRGSSYANVDNLAPAFFDQIVRRYEGTRLGRQELEGHLLEDVEGAFWNRAMLDRTRVKTAPDLKRIVVAVDPATTHGEDADFTGIAVAGVGFDEHVYVLHAEQVRLGPDGWARRVTSLYDEYAADAVVAERNQGGEMVEHTIRTVRASATLRIKTVHASRGKAVRAEPVVALYEQGRAHHVGTFADLEDQMCSFPVAVVHEDILDAAVYAIGELSGPSRALWRSGDAHG